jgi:hypothetical protein
MQSVPIATDVSLNLDQGPLNNFELSKVLYISLIDVQCKILAVYSGRDQEQQQIKPYRNEEGMEPKATNLLDCHWTSMGRWERRANVSTSGDIAHGYFGWFLK